MVWHARIPQMKGSPVSTPSCTRGRGSGFRVQGSGFRVQGSGFRVQRTPHQVSCQEPSSVGVPKLLKCGRALPADEDPLVRESVFNV
jgi:hypothetical protein